MEKLVFSHFFYILTRSVSVLHTSSLQQTTKPRRVAVSFISRDYSVERKALALLHGGESAGECRQHTAPRNFRAGLQKVTNTTKTATFVIY